MKEENDSCVFCHIIRGDTDAHWIAQTENFAAFLDHLPMAPGHTLVVPKKHWAKLSDVPAHLLGEYLRFCQSLAKVIIAEVDAPGFNLFQNNDAVAGQVVFHAHFHIIPRKKNDGIRYQRFLKPMSAHAQKDLVGKLINRKENACLNISTMEKRNGTSRN